MELEAREAICRRCGTCCHKKIVSFDGTVIIHPVATCQHLGVGNACQVYDHRPCYTHEEMINTDGVLPEDCPYTKLRPGYVPARVATIEEFDAIFTTIEQMRQELAEMEEKMKAMQKGEFDA